MKFPSGPDPVRVQIRNTDGIAHISFLACINFFSSQAVKKNMHMYPGLSFG